MPVSQMTDEEAEEFYGKGLVIFGTGLREQYEESLKRRKRETPAKPVGEERVAVRKVVRKAK